MLTARYVEYTAQNLQGGLTTTLAVGSDMKLSIKAELVYDFAQDTQIIANLEAS